MRATHPCTQPMPAIYVWEMMTESKNWDCPIGVYETEAIALMAIKRISMYPAKNGRSKPDRCFLCPRCGLWHLSVTREKCPWSGKLKFYSEEQADNFVRKHRKKDSGEKSVRSLYRCKDCDCWHVSKMSSHEFKEASRKSKEFQLDLVQLQFDRKIYKARHL